MDAAIVLLVLVLPYLFAVWSVLWTIAHTWQEARPEDGGPIWEYLRLPVPGDRSGLLLLLAFGGAQVWLAWAGFVGGSAAALLTLAAVRLADCVLSHWWPWHLGKRPNPGLSTTPLYAFDTGLAVTQAAGWWY